ncbi:MAG: ACT domain-containing protein [Spirochaetaceae bacterium]
MSGEENLNSLLKNMSPILDDNEYVFITTDGTYGDYIALNPLCTFLEKEGLTLILTKSIATSEGLKFEGVFKRITLEVHSSLNAVGLTAAVASKLTDNNISANVVAAYYHDHIFIQYDLADKAMKCLIELTLN